MVGSRWSGLGDTRRPPEPRSGGRFLWSKALREFRQVLDCGSPLPLWNAVLFPPALDTTARFPDSLNQLRNTMYSVLLADDSEDDQMLFKLAMRKVPGLRLVGIAPDGDQAMAYLEGRGQFADRKKFPYPDLLFLDLKMPRVNGFDVLSWLKRKEQRPFVAVFSGSELETDVKLALELGADTYKVKPSNSDAYVTVLKTVQDQLRRQHKDIRPVDQT
jgi:CheY-like chemotaxis protein